MQGKTLACATVTLVCLAVSIMAAAQFGCSSRDLAVAAKPIRNPTPDPKDMVDVAKLLAKVDEALGRAEGQLTEKQHATLESVVLALQTVAVDQDGAASRNLDRQRSEHHKSRLLAQGRSFVSVDASADQHESRIRPQPAGVESAKR